MGDKETLRWTRKAPGPFGSGRSTKVRDSGNTLVGGVSTQESVGKNYAVSAIYLSR